MSQALARKDRVKWLLGMIGLLIIPGALWLASFLISYPQEAMAYSKKYGVYIWIGVSLAWSILCWARKKMNQK